MKRPLLLGAGVAVLAIATGVILFGRDGSLPPAARPHAVTVVQVPALPHAAITSSPIATVAPAPVPSAALSPAPTTATTLPSQDHVARLRGIMKAFPQQKAMFETLRSERRDPQWAPRSEAMLTALYGAMPYAGEAGRTLDIYCGSINCVAMGDLPAHNLHGEVNQAMAAMQSIDLTRSLMAKGYTPNGSAFGPSTTDNRQMFVTFYRRSAPVAIRTR